METIQNKQKLEAYLNGVFDTAIATDFIYIEDEKKFEFSVDEENGVPTWSYKYITHFIESDFENDEHIPKHTGNTFYVPIGTALSKVYKDFIQELKSAEKAEYPELKYKHELVNG